MHAANVTVKQKKTKERNKIQTQKKRQPPIRDCFEILFLKFREKKQQQKKIYIFSQSFSQKKYYFEKSKSVCANVRGSVKK